MSESQVGKPEHFEYIDSIATSFRLSQYQHSKQHHDT